VVEGAAQAERGKRATCAGVGTRTFAAASAMPCSTSVMQTHRRTS